MSVQAKVLATRKFPEQVEQRLMKLFDGVISAQEMALTSAQLLEKSQGMDALLCAPGDPLSAEVIGQLPASIKIIATFSVGFDHINIPAAKERAIVVTNTPGVLSDATAEIAMLCLLGAARRAREGLEMLTSGKWQGWHPTQLMGWQLTKKRLGILGMGSIGQALARRARAFDMEIHYHNRSRLQPELEAGAIYHESAEDLLRISDFLSLHCPLTAETKGYLNRKRIELMPEGAIVINTARGGVVDDEALIAALQSGRLAAAGLDVFEGEPKLDRRYQALENAFILPHLGSATHETRLAMGMCALDNLEAFFAGRECPNRVV